MTIEVRALDSTLGAEVRGIDLEQPLNEKSWAEIEAAFHQHAVLFFKAHGLSDDQQVAFTRHFGKLERLISKRSKNQEIAVLANLQKGGKVAPVGGSLDLFLRGNSYWHTDSSFKRVPAKASLLSARVVPSSGGETEFADMRAAWDELDAAMQERLDGKIAVHDYRYSQGLIGGLDILSQEDWDALPPVEHPIVRTHPVTGRRSLYIGRHASHIVGEEVEEGRALLAKLCEDACQPPRTVLHTWEVGDLVAWDNRCVLHRGRTYPVDEPRVMHRTTVAGDDADNEWAL